MPVEQRYMRFVLKKTLEEQDIQALDHARQRLDRRVSSSSGAARIFGISHRGRLAETAIAIGRATESSTGARPAEARRDEARYWGWSAAPPCER